MIRPILEARTEIKKLFHSFFGGNENNKICFWNLLTFSRITDSWFFSEEHNLFEAEKSSIHNLKMFSKIFYQPIEIISLVLHFISSWRSLILWSLITENELIWNATLCRHRFLRQFFLSFFHQMHFSQFFQSYISQVL